jgi:uncharacterized protein YjbJ (UPF0337 family)
MGENMDETKGRVKEAAGDLTDDKDLKREGKMDQAGASVKEKTGNAVDTVKEKVNDAAAPRFARGRSVFSPGRPSLRA